MNPAYVALISSAIAASVALLTPIIVNRLSRDTKRADVAKSYQEVASDAADDIKQLRADVRDIRTALEGLTLAVSAAIPLLEAEHPDVAENLRTARSAARQVI